MALIDPQRFASDRTVMCPRCAPTDSRRGRQVFEHLASGPLIGRGPRPVNILSAIYELVTGRPWTTGRAASADYGPPPGARLRRAVGGVHRRPAAQPR